MKFYTNVLLLGDNILYRGYENGQEVKYRDRIRPTLYFVTQDQRRESPYRTLDGRYAHPQKFDGARDAREFIQKYDAVDGLRSMVTNDSFTNGSLTSSRDLSTSICHR